MTAMAEGTVLPEKSFDVTPTFVVSTAIATRDYQDVHHDRDSAIARGSKDIFVNILTTTGLVQDIRLGVRCYASERHVLSGRVVRQEGAEVEVAVIGRVSLGDHVTGTVLVRTGAAAR